MRVHNLLVSQKSGHFEQLQKNDATSLTAALSIYKDHGQASVLPDLFKTLEGRERSQQQAIISFLSDVKDTDVTIKLIDVYPDGKAYNLDETIQRVRYREGYDKEVWMENGKVYEIKMTPMSTSNYFEKGHSIRIEVSSSNFPRFDRNMNTGGNTYDETKGIVANNSIHHGGKFQSKIVLPIVKK